LPREGQWWKPAAIPEVILLGFIYLLSSEHR